MAKERTPPRRILVAECIHEICSFNPVPTRYEDFFVNTREQVLAFHRGIGSEVAGALHVFSGHPEIIVPTFSARGITSGGIIPAADFERLVAEFRDELRQAGPVDAAYFALHGAMAAENEDDPEGLLLVEARKILGENTPIVASFDLHGVLTDRMLEQTNGSVVYHTYPHVDFFETGERAARLLLRLLEGDIHPVTAKVEIPALVRGDELITATGAFGELIRHAQKIEQEPNVISAGMYIGNPFTDVPDLRCYSVVTTDNDPARAEKEALYLANEFWQKRESMQVRLTPLADSIRLATTLQGTVALIDAADATSSGASGDSNVILREIVQSNYPGRSLVPIVDPPAVAKAAAAGIGAEIETTVGGALDAKRFTPLAVRATVKMLSDGRFRSESFKQEWYSGPTAVLQTGRVTLVVTSRPVHLFDRSLFFAHGQNPCDFDLVVVKSPHCQPHMYSEWCARMIHVDATGSTSANLPSLGHTRCRRPIFPLDPDVVFEPKAKMFSRKPM